jgi:hypothetical protein
MPTNLKSVALIELFLLNFVELRLEILDLEENELTEQSMNYIELNRSLKILNLSSNDRLLDGGMELCAKNHTV